jgi:hypothetical protein
MTQDRDLNLILEPRTAPPTNHIHQPADQQVDEPKKHPASLPRHAAADY